MPDELTTDYWQDVWVGLQSSWGLLLLTGAIAVAILAVPYFVFRRKDDRRRARNG